MAEDLLAAPLIPAAKIPPDAGMEAYHNTQHGNGDRFWARNAGEVLLHQQGGSSVFYSTREDGRWVRGEGKGAGDVNRRARDVIEEMRARARALGDQAAQEENETLAKRADALRKWANASDNSNAAVLMAKSACTDYGAVCDPDEMFDANQELLATPGGVLDLTGGNGVVYREIRPADMVSYSTAVEYRPEILETPPAEVTLFLETFLPDPEHERLLWKALGSALLGGNAHRLLIILHGSSGTNGKTQLVEAIRSAMGDYAGIGTPSIFRGNLEDKPRPDVISLLKKRVAFLAEASKAWELHGDRVKAVTGGDGLKLRRMRTDEFLETIPQFTPVIYTNGMPRVSGADQALKRRMLVIDFNHQPEKEDPGVKQRFLASVAVREWLLARLVQGYLDVLATGVEDVRNRFAEQSQEGFDDTSHIGEFFEWLRDSEQLSGVPEEDRVHGMASRYVLARVMHERYQYWTRTHGNIQDKKDVMNYREFNAALRDNMGWRIVKNAGYRWEGWLLRDASSLGLLI